MTKNFEKMKLKLGLIFDQINPQEARRTDPIQFFSLFRVEKKNWFKTMKRTIIYIKRFFLSDCNCLSLRFKF